MEIVAVPDAQGEIRLDSRALAERMENTHASVMKLVQDNRSYFEDFGILRFEIEETGKRGQPARFALLNEDQCYFLLTLVRNSETTVPMKAVVVAAFGKARAALAQMPVASPLALARLMLEGLEETTGRVAALEARLDASPITGEKLGTVYRLGQQLGQSMGDYRRAWRLFKDRFSLASYRDLPADRYEDAVHFLRLQIASYTGQPLLDVPA